MMSSSLKIPSFCFLFLSLFLLTLDCARCAYVGNVVCNSEEDKTCFCGNRDDGGLYSYFWNYKYGSLSNDTRTENTVLESILNADFVLEQGSDIAIVNTTSHSDGEAVVDSTSKGLNFEVGTYIKFDMDYWSKVEPWKSSSNEQVQQVGTKMDRLYGEANGLGTFNKLFLVKEISEGERKGEYKVKFHMNWPGDSVTVLAKSASAWATCGTKCIDPNAFGVQGALGKCAPYVNYEFCARKMNDAFPGDLSELDAVRKLGMDALSCLENSVFYDEDWEDSSSTCSLSILKSACYAAFPKCSKVATNPTPLPICSSTCAHEILECRTIGTGFGHRDLILQGCSISPWAGNDEDCTGAANSIVPYTGYLFFFINLFLSIQLAYY